MKPPTYFDKFKTHCSKIGNESSFLVFLEELNQSEWIEFIQDICLETHWPILIKRYRSDTSLLGYFAIFFDKLGEPSHKLIRNALNAHVYQYRAAPDSETRTQILRQVIELSSILRWGIDREALADWFVTRTDVPDDIREHAAIALAVYDEPTSVKFWTERVELKAYPLLAYARILALEDVAPRKALETYLLMQSRPDDISGFEFPTVDAVHNLLESGRGEELLELIESMPQWARDYFDKEILEMDGLRARLNDVREERDTSMTVSETAEGEPPIRGIPTIESPTVPSNLT